jgi:prepilin-type N-terminal cleavage/methylation domain-containing protein
VTTRTIEPEAGFTLIELVICIAILALVGAATVGALAAVARNAMPNVTRDAALMVAENALVRARAAAVYVPLGTGVASSDPAAAHLLNVGALQYVAGASLQANERCGTGGTHTLQFPVTTSYGSNVFTVTVRYPRNPCSTTNDETLTESETLAPPVYLPEHVVGRAVAVPARM